MDYGSGELLLLDHLAKIESIGVWIKIGPAGILYKASWTGADLSIKDSPNSAVFLGQAANMGVFQPPEA